MPAGRPKKPSALKELQGTARPDRSNPSEPRLPVRIPDAPAWVDEAPTTRALFDQVTKYVTDMNIATQVDGLALSLLADQIALYIELRSHIREEGTVVTVTGSTGQDKTMAHPAIPQLNQTLGSIHKLLREYGLTAASRSNMSAHEEKDVDSFADFLAN